MTKSNFKSKTFYWIVILFLTVILIWNLYSIIYSSNLLGLLPITIQFILLALIFTKHKYAKLGIKFWAILFLIISSGLQFIGRLLQDMGNGFINVDFQHYLTTALTVLIGIIIVIYTNKTVETNEVE